MAGRWGLLVLAVFAAGTVQAEEFRLRGMCEASGSVLLDESAIAVASDDRSGVAVYAIDAATQAVPDGAMPEATTDLGEITDIEAAAKVGDTVLWMTSQSTNKDGLDKPKRRKLVATSWQGGKLAVTGQVYDGLRALIAPALIANGYPHDVETDPGPDGRQALNIEGMAAATGGDLWFGLRAPLIDGKAVLVRVSGLSGLVIHGKGTPKVEEVLLRDLGGNGIRGMETLADGYAILGGPSAQSDDDAAAKAGFPALYAWDGAGEVKHVSDLPTGFVAEAILALSTSRVMVLSDNGSALIDGKKCKDDKTPADKAWFPGLILPSP